MLIGLPSCKWRGPTDPVTETFSCGSPRYVAAGTGGINASTCRQCEKLGWVDHEAPAGKQNPPDAPDRCPRLWRRARNPDGTVKTTLCTEGCARGTVLDVFECNHPKHAETTLMFCRTCPDRPPKQERIKLLLRLDEGAGTSPGDVTVMTAALESLHRSYPGRYLTAAKTSCDAVFENNPYAASFGPGEGGVREIRMRYDLIHDSNQRAVHFMAAFCAHLEKELGVPVPLRTTRPHLYLSERERDAPSQVESLTGYPGPFWLVNAGTKQDLTAKGWGHHHYQEVVRLLRGRVRFVQIGSREHLHRPLEGVWDFTGWTDARQLVRLAERCEGGLGPSTFLQHLCAAWGKPYVCLLGGREPVPWVQYPKQTTLHSVGALQCCRHGACWKSRTVPLGDGAEQDGSLCERPVTSGPEPVPECLQSFTPRQVADCVLRYTDGFHT